MDFGILRSHGDFPLPMEASESTWPELIDAGRLDADWKHFEFPVGSLQAPRGHRKGREAKAAVAGIDQGFWELWALNKWKNHGKIMGKLWEITTQGDYN